MLYTPKSARDKGTLYQLRNVLDRKNVVSNPKKDFHACHDFLQTVVDGYIIAAACTIFKVKSPADITEKMIFPNGKPVDAKTTLSAIEDISATIELRYTKYAVSPISASTDGIFKYSRYLLSLGLLAHDSWTAGGKGMVLTPCACRNSCCSITSKEDIINMLLKHSAY
jgi:L1 cell adhesion molecule like protein